MTPTRSLMKGASPSNDPSRRAMEPSKRDRHVVGRNPESGPIPAPVLIVTFRWRTFNIHSGKGHAWINLRGSSFSRSLRALRWAAIHLTLQP